MGRGLCPSLQEMSGKRGDFLEERRVIESRGRGWRTKPLAAGARYALRENQKIEFFA